MRPSPPDRLEAGRAHSLDEMRDHCLLGPKSACEPLFGIVLMFWSFGGRQNVAVVVLVKCEFCSDCCSLFGLAQTEQYNIIILRSAVHINSSLLQA